MKKSTKSGLALLIGTLVGAILAFLFGTDEKGDTRKEVKATVKKSKEAIKKVDKKKVLETVGKKADEASKYVTQARKDVEKKLASLKKSFDSIDKTKYSATVNQVVEEFKKTGKATSKQLADLKALLMADYATVTKKDTKKKGK